MPKHNRKTFILIKVHLFCVSLFCPKYKDHIQKVTTWLWYKDITIAYNHIMDLYRKLLRSELSFSREGTCRRFIIKSLKLQCCSLPSPKDVFKHSRPKNHRRSKKKKTSSTLQKTERPLTVNITINKNETPSQTRCIT